MSALNVPNLQASFNAVLAIFKATCLALARQSFLVVEGVIVKGPKGLEALVEAG